MKSQCCANDLFVIGRYEHNNYCFLLYLLIVQRKQQKELRNRNFKLSTYILDRISSYSNQDLNNIDITFYDIKIYVPQIIRIHVIDWYNLYLNQPVVKILAKTIREVCDWEVLVLQE